MDARDAVELVNWFPTANAVTSRPGYLQHCDVGTSAPIARMFEFEYGPYHRLLASSNGGLYDVTGNQVRVLGGGFSDDQWSAACLSGRMILVNGSDFALSFDGNTLSLASFTGVSTDVLSHVCVHKSRIFAVERESQTFWFGDPNAIGGALSDFDLSTVGHYGGHLLMCMSISRDGFNGPDDYLVCIFTSGDGVIYQGTDPGDAANWAIVGHFKCGRPLGRHAAVDYGDTIVLLTERGYESLKNSIPFGTNVARTKIQSDKIRQAVKTAVERSRFNDEWQVACYARSDMLIVNVPTPDGQKTEQHVQNVSTGAWCRFLDLNATTWCRFGTSIYFGSIDGKVHWFDGAANDNGQPITCNALTAWDYLGNRARKKIHRIQSCVFESERMPKVRLSIGTDFNFVRVGPAVTLLKNTDVSYWDQATWDQDYFGSGRTAVRAWTKNAGVGVASACRVYASVVNAPVSWNSITYVFEPGGIV